VLVMFLMFYNVSHGSVVVEYATEAFIHANQDTIHEFDHLCDCALSFFARHVPNFTPICDVHDTTATQQPDHLLGICNIHLC
jgi:hypothetical protein